jgi:hypothetical protein
MTIQLKDPAILGDGNIPVRAELVISGVKFQNWGYSLPENDFVLEYATFKALSVDIVDAEGTATVGPVFEG